MFISELILGALLIGLTVVIHAVALDRIMRILEKTGPKIYGIFKKAWKIPMLITTVLSVFVAHIIEIWAWAFFYLSVDAIDGLERALYFSTVAFTTVGFGDVVLDNPEWRLISSFQAANGFMLFGWSTAFIFEIMSKLYKDDVFKKTEGPK